MRTEPYRYEEETDNEAWVNDADLVGFFHPREILHDAILTRARKRRLLSYWLSDVHAVPGNPGMRQYLFGPSVPVDDLQWALSQLDEVIDAEALPPTFGQSASA